VAAQDNEEKMVAIPPFFEPLDLSSPLVSVESIGCRAAVAHQIVDAGVNCILEFGEFSRLVAADQTGRAVAGLGGSIVAVGAARDINGKQRVERRYIFASMKQIDYAAMAQLPSQSPTSRKPKTASTGNWTNRSTKISAGSAREIALRTSPARREWPSTVSSNLKRPREAIGTN
jgi:hypothetical protein